MGRMAIGNREFFANADVRGITECWNYKKAPTERNPYVRTSCLRLTGDARRLLPVHHIAFGFTHGALPPKGWIVHHVCNNKRCVNPAHLLLMTRGDHNRLHKSGEWGNRPGYLVVAGR